MNGFTGEGWEFEPADVERIGLEDTYAFKRASRYCISGAEFVPSPNGGHSMLFTAFDGKLMMLLHAPNGPGAQPRIFEMEDTGEPLRIVAEFADR